MFFISHPHFTPCSQHIVAKKLIKVHIPRGFFQWILAYLTNRSKFVCLDRHCCSDVITTNTGNTADCRKQDVSYPLIKFADDTAMIDVIHDNDGTKYQLHLSLFVDYCNTNYLQLSISMTKELFTDFRRTASPSPAVLIIGVEADRVSSYKHLGIHQNDCLILE